MKFYFWKYEGGKLGTYDIFCIANKSEMNAIVEYFGDTKAESVCSNEEKVSKYYYLLNTNEMTITPLTKLSYAYGGMYNDDIPVGREHKGFTFKVEDYKLTLFDNKSFDAREKKLKLNDLLNLTDEEISRTKIRFNQAKGEENPIELFKCDPNSLLRWNYWNSQSYKVGQISIGLVKMHDDEWLLFTVGKIMQVRERKPNSCVACEYKTENGRYGHLFGRVIVRYHKTFQTQFPNAKTVLDDLEVKEILPSVFSGFDFPGYDNVSLTYNQLKRIISGNYPSYRNALENQQAVYLLTDTKTGKLYVGSATSKSEMLFARWKGYVTTYHNGNKKLKDLFNREGASYFEKYFKYSIIENFNAKVNAEFVRKRESYWKEVFDSRMHGYNDN